MARIGDDLHASGPAQGTGPKILTADHGQVLVPTDAFIAHGDLVRDGQDLILKAEGQSLVIKGYFSAEPHPVIHSPSGATLTPDLVHSFAHHDGPVQYADNAKANDASPVGVVKEVHGHATIHHTDGTTETIIVGTAVHEGDVIETDAAGAVNIMFRDNSSFAVSHNAKLAIDEYVFDPHSDAGASNFSMLRGVFVYTSGLIGHQDPDDVHIHTPAGSIGIRGTVIAGNVDTGTVTVVEGAIVLTSNTGEETTLSSQYETAQFDTSTGKITNEGTLSAATLSTDYSSLSDVAPGFFSSLGTTTTPDTTTSPDGSTTAPDSTTPTTSPTDGGHTDITSPDATTTTAATGSISTDTDTTTADATTVSLLDTGSLTGDTFGTDTGIFSTDPSTTFVATDSTTTTSSLLTSTTTTSGTGSLALTSPVDTSTTTTTTTSGGTSGSGSTVGTIFSPPPPPPPPPAPSDHFFILDSNGESFGSSIAVVQSASGFDGLVVVKQQNASVGGGLFFDVAGGASNPGDQTVPSLTNHNAHMLTSDANMVIASIGAFGMSSAPLYIVGSPMSDSIDLGPPRIGGLISASGNINIVDASGNIVETIGGLTSVGEAFGASVAGIGDINGDGYNDVIIGSPGLFPQAGAAYVLYGGHVADATGSPAALDLAPLVSASPDGFIVNGTGTAQLGMNVSGAGDFDNDGYSDFMVSSPGTGAVDIHTNGSLISLSVSTGNTDIPLLKLGDVSSDGISDIGIVSAVDKSIYIYNGANGVTAVGGPNFTVTTTSSTGTITGGAVGDFNGDGKSDLGVIMHNGTHADIYVVYGGTLAGGGSLDETTLNSTNSFHMNFDATSASDLTGMYITSAGDMNGDGLGDFAIGLPELNGGDGGVMVVYGREGGVANFVNGTNPTATTGSQALVGTSGNDTMSDGTFGSISFSGGAGDDTIKVATNAFTSINGGSGKDTIAFIPAGGSLDFTGLNSEQIGRIEAINLTNNSQSLTLNIANILDMMESSDTGTLTITGGTTNFLSIKTGTANVGLTAGGIDSMFTTLTGSVVTDTPGAAGYTDFHIGSHTLAIDNNLITSNHVSSIV
jgi:hypothetical protein